MSDNVKNAFEEFLRTRRDHRDGLTARQQLWTAFEAGAQFTLDEIRERTGLSHPTQETRAPQVSCKCPAGPGRDCPLTISECNARAAANRESAHE